MSMQDPQTALHQCWPRLRREGIMESKALGYSFDVELAGLVFTYDPEYRRSDDGHGERPDWIVGNVQVVQVGESRQKTRRDTYTVASALRVLWDGDHTCEAVAGEVHRSYPVKRGVECLHDLLNLIAKLTKVRNGCDAEFREVDFGFAMKDTEYAAIQNMFGGREQYRRVVVLLINRVLLVSIGYGLTLVNL
jgi:hypothetical protein